MRGFFKSFAWAARGIVTAVREERNLRFHLCTAVYVYLFSIFYPFSALDYVLLTIIVGGVLALEIMNSALERTVDTAQPRRDQKAGAAKDMAAGAVLVFCIGAAVCGFLLFWDIETFKTIFSYFSHRPLQLVLLGASLVLSGWFVFGLNKKKGGG